MTVADGTVHVETQSRLFGLGRTACCSGKVMLDLDRLSIVSLWFVDNAHKATGKAIKQ